MNKQQRAELKARVAQKNGEAPAAAPVKVAEPLRFECGHKVGSLGQCPACQAAARKERNIRRAEKFAAKRATPTWGERGRLPDGARFDVVYDAASGTWTGSLEIDVPGQEGVKLTNTASGVFKLLQQLDDQYRGRTADSAAG